MSWTLSAKLCRAKRKELAPKVLVSIISAPACRYRGEFPDQIRLREVQLIVGTVDENAFGVKKVPIAPSHSTGDCLIRRESLVPYD